MPEPEKRKIDLLGLINDIVLLQQNAMPDKEIYFKRNKENLSGFFDVTMMGQVFTNLIKNAGEAIDSFIEVNDIKNNSYKGKITIKKQHSISGTFRHTDLKGKVTMDFWKPFHITYSTKARKYI